MKTAAAIALLLTAGAAIAADYPSPDASLTAKVEAAAPPSCEPVIEISAGSSILGKKSYASASHEDGSCVAHAAWSPDSKFFVFSLSNSGGHQPWNSPIVVFSVGRKRFADLSVGSSEAITDPTFTLSSPSRIDFEVTTLPLDDNHPKRRQIDLEKLN